MKTVKDTLIKMCATCFYLGYVPPASGSLASIVGMVLCLSLHQSVSLYVLVCCIITVAGFIVSDHMEKMTQEKDPSCIVIDEISGAMIAFFLLPVTPAVIITAFFLFRAFDMFKIYPANKFEKMPGGAGVMLDDIIAGIYTNLIMHSALLLIR